MECRFCKELNEEKYKITTDTIYIMTAGYYNYRVPIRYCPYCGKILDKYKADNCVEEK